MGAMLYRTSMIKQYGIRFQNIKASEDKIFSMQCLYLANEIYLINQLMYLYRQNATSAVHMRARGIPYFVPIIDAYIQLDAEMKRWENDVRGSFHEGRVLAKIYIMDMIEEEWEKAMEQKGLQNCLPKDWIIRKVWKNRQVTKQLMIDGVICKKTGESSL